eukprot:5007843-Amphidinium_carterae.3
MESDEFMDIGIGEPDSPMAFAELVTHLTETSANTYHQLDVLRVNLQRQQFDVTMQRRPIR